MNVNDDYRRRGPAIGRAEDPLLSREKKEIQTLRRAILNEAQAQAQAILADAQAQAAKIREEARQAAAEEAERYVAQVRTESEGLEERAAAAARLEAQRMHLKRREAVLRRVFDTARERLASAPAGDDYPSVAEQLVREGLERLGAVDAATLRADEATDRVLVEGQVLERLEEELGVELHVGPTLEKGIGVVLQTPDAHRRYDNTFESRLARLWPTLRTRAYHILMGDGENGGEAV